MMSKQIPQKERELIHACKVLDAVRDGIEYVAANPMKVIKSKTFPKLPPLPAIEVLPLELIQGYPQVLEALLTITREDCRMVLYDFCQSIYKLEKICLNLKAQKAKIL